MFHTKSYHTSRKRFFAKLALLKFSTKAEESSILQGAKVVNSDDFPTTYSGFWKPRPETDMFFGPGFKTILYSDDNTGHLNDYSKEVIIQMTETHRVITVFFA